MSHRSNIINLEYIGPRAMQTACKIPWVQFHKKTMPATPNAQFSQWHPVERVVLYSFFFLAPLTFAVPRSVFCLFLRCLPVNQMLAFHPCMIYPYDYRIEIMCSGYRRTLLSAWLLNLACKSNADQSVVWLELLQCLWWIIDEGESSSLSTTELSLKTEDVYLVLVGLVKLGEFGS